MSDDLRVDSLTMSFADTEMRLVGISGKDMRCIRVCTVALPRNFLSTAYDVSFGTSE